MLSLRPSERLPSITATAIVIVIIFSSVTVFALCVSRCANHASKASAIQVIHSVHTVGTFLRIPTDPSVLIFWVAITVALCDTFLMFSTILFFIIQPHQQPLHFSPATFSASLSRGLCNCFLLLFIIMAVQNSGCRDILYNDWAASRSQSMQRPKSLQLTS